MIKIIEADTAQELETKLNQENLENVFSIYEQKKGGLVAVCKVSVRLKEGDVGFGEVVVDKVIIPSKKKVKEDRKKEK